MTYRIPRRRRLDAAAALLLTLVLAVTAAHQARADGEDDPTFGAAGTAFADLGRGHSEFGPFVRQAPSGQVYVAVGEDDDRRGGDGVHVARFDSAGDPLPIAGEQDGVALLPTAFEYLLDFAIMENGDLVLAGRNCCTTPPSRGGEPAVGIARFTADGDPVDEEQFFSGLDCVGDQDVQDAAITGDGGVVTAWNGCSEFEQSGDTRGATERPEGTLVARYGTSNDSSVVVPEEVDELTHVALGPNGQVFALGLPNADNKGRGFDDDTLTLRFRNDESGELQFDPNYEQGPLPGVPVDLAVDGSGRALVWFNDTFFRRGGDDPGTWSIARRQAVSGDLDPGWGDEGVVDLTDDRVGPAQVTECSNCPNSQVSYLTPQADGKVLALGLSDYPIGVRGEEDGIYSERTIVRFEEDGDLDPAWGDEGFKPYVLGQPSEEEDFAEFEDVTAPALQSDGKVLVPFISFRPGQKQPRVPTPPEGRSVGVTRLGLSPTEEPPGQQPPPPQQPAAVVTPPASATAPSQAPKACKSRRRFAITLRTGRRKAERSPIVSAVVRVNGKRVTVTRAARRRASVNLTNLPPGRFTVTISLRLKDGGTVRETRRYRTCAKKVERELGPLRTRAPRSKRS